MRKDMSLGISDTINSCWFVLSYLGEFNRLNLTMGLYFSNCQYGMTLKQKQEQTNKRKFLICNFPLASKDSC